MTNTINEVETTINNYSWLRQDKEPENSYKWYTYYRDMEGHRVLKKIPDLIRAREPYLEKFPTYQQIKNASSLWCWKARTRDYDNYLQLQLLDKHKETLILYEEETIKNTKKINNILQDTLNDINNNNDIDPLKKLKCLELAGRITRGMLADLEHITQKEPAHLKYIDLPETRERNIINTLIDINNGVRPPEELTQAVEGYTTEEVEEIIKRTINKRRVKNTYGNYVHDNGHDTIIYNGVSYEIPK